jgi:ATP-dependent protease HslVU (ClpYQ) peptidase subunit
MTTIAVNKNEIACDMQATHRSGYKLKVQTKIHHYSNPLVYPKPFYIGFAGSLEDAHSVLEWFNSPNDKPPKVRESEYIILTEDKKIYTFANPLRWIQISEPFYAIGSGGQFALGALHSGKSPKEAVLIASKCDPATGLGVKSFDFKK